MLNKLISALLVLAVVIVGIPRPRVFAQNSSETSNQVPASAVEPNPATLPAKAKSDLRKSLGAELADIKAGARTTGELERRLQQEQNQQSVADPKAGWSRKKKLWVALALVLTAGALWVAIKHRCKDRPEKPCPEIESTDYYY